MAAAFVGASAFTSPFVGSSSGLVPMRRQATGASGVSGLSMENFFLPLGEDPEKNTPKQIYGEENYKEFISSYTDKSLLTKRYPLLTRVREQKLLTATADSGLLTALEEKGVTLSDIEALLPVVEELGALSFVAKNKEFLLNTVAPLAVEPAPALLPLAVSALKTDPGTYTALAAGLVLTEVAVAVLGQNVALDVVAAIPLLGGAAALFAVSNVLRWLWQRSLTDQRFQFKMEMDFISGTW